MGIIYNAEKTHSLACISPPAVEVWFLVDQGLVLVLAHCAGIVDSWSKPDSGGILKDKPLCFLPVSEQVSGIKIGRGAVLLC